MIDLLPFCGLRYDPAIIGDVGRVLAPPYDVIAEDERRRLHAAHPHNIVRLICSQPLPQDTEAHNRYTRANDAFQDWRQQRILRRDAAPSIYLYEQAFIVGGRSCRRLGFIALMRLDAMSNDNVFRHEQTFQGPKTDRERLLHAVRANLSPIFCLYPDGPEGAIHAELCQWADRLPPVVDTRVFDERDRLWPLTDQTAIERLRHAMRSKRIIIADGHHRYEVALTNRHLSPTVMTYFGWLEDPAMVVLPIHRLVQMQRAPTFEMIEERLRHCVQIAAVSEPEILFRMLDAGRDEVGLFGLYAQGQYRLLRLQSSEVPALLRQQGAPEVWSTLDVALLHYVLLPHLADGEAVAQWQITYTKDAGEAVQWAEERKDRLAFLLNPMPVHRIQDVALQGYRLPHKSTYFYPKLLSGLIINPFD